VDASARKEDEGWTKKTLKAQTEGLAEIISDFFNSIDPNRKRTAMLR
jgi:hypothetical protein